MKAQVTNNGRPITIISLYLSNLKLTLRYQSLTACIFDNKIDDENELYIDVQDTYELDMLINGLTRLRDKAKVSLGEWKKY